MDRYEKALEQARNYYPDNLFLDTIFPELRESEDEMTRKFLKDYAIEMIAGLESDISISVYDGIKGHDPEAEAELEKWKGVRAWLEKQKEQKPAEWSEEDERIRQSLIMDLGNAETDDADVQKELDEQVAWLKSIRPQPHWKPSEEQMEALHSLVCIGGLSYMGQQKLLIELEQDIKENLM